MFLFSKNDQQKKDSAQVLEDLIEGNKRFCSNTPLNRESLQKLGAQASKVGQFPKAIVLSCMDSRSIPEIVFDQSIGDILTLRVAGNVVNKDILASIEYAIKHVGVKLIVIMGHTGCGAIATALEGTQGENLSHLLGAILPAVKAQASQSNQEGSIVTDITLQHVQNMVERSVEESSVLRDMITQKKVNIVGALHDLESGSVGFKYAKGLIF
ncbi:carbonic anhydrase [bacterium]|jgi:carbonic anhydrase|nr:carbonic anhydrase [bacterium]MBT5015478.1 carbonic anhydrase [bacterium]